MKTLEELGISPIRARKDKLMNLDTKQDKVKEGRAIPDRRRCDSALPVAS